MRSSDAGGRLIRRGGGAALAAAMISVACSSAPVAEPRVTTPPVAEQGAATPPPVDCAPAGAISGEAAGGLAATRTAAEGGPLYAALAARSSLTSCRVSSDATAVTLDYTFTDGGTLSFTRDPKIEYSNQELRFGAPVSDDGVGLLRRVEQTSFSPDGCGIDWQEATRLPPASGVDETAYYGEVCSCQARVRTDSSTRLVGLTFRSAC